MLRSRIIPCLLLHKGGLVKTTKFKSHKYVGDPVNAIRIFNEKRADELLVLDIDATVENRAPDFDLIRDFARECRMPLAYGGGVVNEEQARRIIGLGVEKVALSASAISNPDLIANIAGELGSQSVVGVLDLKVTGFVGKKLMAFTHNGTRVVKRDVAELVQAFQDAGVGEIVLNFVDRDGTMEGYDFEAVKSLKPLLRVPLTILGGAGSLEDIGKLIDQNGIIGAAAGSIFVFKGRHRAVLINYPTLEERKRLQ